jgi:hypothetical protein
MKLSSNYAILRDSYISNNMNVRNETYTSSKLNYILNADLIPGSPYTPFIAFNFFLDEEITINEREAFTIVQALQGVGGFASIILAFSRFSFYFIQRYLFEARLVEKLSLYSGEFEQNKRKLPPSEGRDPSFGLD